MFASNTQLSSRQLLNPKQEKTLLKSLVGTFFRGLSAVLPIALTLWLLVWVVSATDALLRSALVHILPQTFYFPGLGIIVAIGLIFAAGLLMQLFLFERIWQWFESRLERVPLVKTVYQAVNDLFGFFSSNVSDEASKVACIRFGDGTRLIGFVTDESVAMFKGADEDLVAVYLPMSYQVGGYTLLVPKAQVEFLDVPAEQAMRFVLTAGIRRQDKQVG
jgi:uncharacterized membrane protein